jgi:hypothetical protein
MLDEAELPPKLNEPPGGGNPLALLGSWTFTTGHASSPEGDWLESVLLRAKET